MLFLAALIALGPVNTVSGGRTALGSYSLSLSSEVWIALPDPEAVVADREQVAHADSPVVVIVPSR